MTKVTTICFDMDGTIASLFSYPNWLELLRAENPTPYAEAKPMWDMEALADILNALREKRVYHRYYHLVVERLERRIQDRNKKRQT